MYRNLSWMIGENFMLLQKYKEAIATTLSPVSITSKTIEFILKHPFKHRGSVRIFTGLIYTDKQYERLREKAFSKKLP